jgi:M6 family metalloprotease-like protein
MTVFSQNDKGILQWYYIGGLSDKLRGITVLSLFILLLGAKVSMAVPACPGGAKVTQPDGTEITIYLRGDEYAHWNESEDGFQIVKSEKSGEWVYIQEEAGAAVAGRHVVGKADPKAIGALRPNKEKMSAQAERSRTEKSMVAEQSAFALTTGTMYNLVVLVNFSDLAVAYPRQSYDDLFNQVGYTADGAVGSVKDYYQEVSYNNLTVQSTVVEAVTLDHGYAYYGANDAYGDDVRPREMVQQALAKLEARGFDFSTVDGDGDGWVDGLTIIHAGGGEEYSGNDSDYIWSHQWVLSSVVTYDGVSMQMYHTEPARRGWDAYPSTQGITRIGVICHENGHFLGLPDLYDYGYDSEGAGDFCLMGGGSWNGNYGTTPAHMSAWCKSSLGWVSPTLMSSGGVYSLGQVETNAQVYKLQGGFPSTQYFLVENRQGVGFDAGLPGSLRGVLIWHIDETQPNNDDQTHYMVDLEEASGTQHLELDLNAGDDADYFRAGNATVFTESSTPNNLSYAGQMLGVNITDVGTSGASMPITIAVGPSISSITPNTGMSGSAVDITDLAGMGFVAGATVKLVKAGQPDIVATNVTVVSATKITCTFSLAGASAGTWDVKVTNPDERWAVLSNGFNVTAVGQFLTENFESPFVGGAPPGWTKSFKTGTVDWTRNVGDYRSGDAAHGGTYNAMLFYDKTSDHETYLITPVINFGTGTTDANLEFWHKQVRWPPDQDTLTVYYKTGAGGSWTQLASYTTNVSAWTKRTISLPNPGSNYYIGFLGNAKYGYGVCIDDVKVTGIVPTQHTISGYVLEQDGNTPVEGVPIQTDGNDVNSVTDANGFYELWVNYNWSGIVTPQKEGYVFEPNGNTYTNVIEDYSDQNYIATLNTFVISGYVFDKDYVAPINDVNVSAENSGGPWTSRYGGGSWLTDANGYYEVVVDYNWSGKVTPTKYAYGFTPANIDYNNVIADQNNQNYTGKPLTFIISGYIKNGCNVPINGVLVDANNGGGQNTTDVNGFYEVWVDYNWSGTVTPTKGHHTFNPGEMVYVDVLADQTEQNYQAINIYDLDCDCTIGYGDLAVIAENWLKTPANINEGDLNNDNIVNFLDFAEFAKHWLE